MAKSYWSEDRYVNAVIKGDCINVMQHLPDGCIDMVLCDLPYGTTQNKWDSIVPLDKLWAEYRRIVKPNGAIVLTSQGLFTAALIMSQPKLFKYKWVWEKSKPFHPVHVYSDGKRYPTDVVYFKTAESEGEVFHATQKPVELGRYFVRTYTNPGDIVLDNTSGSGSFLVAALMEGRNFIGIEKNADTELFKGEKIDYIERTIERLRAAWQHLDAEKREVLRKCNVIKHF